MLSLPAPDCHCIVCCPPHDVIGSVHWLHFFEILLKHQNLINHYLFRIRYPDRSSRNVKISKRVLICGCMAPELRWISLNIPRRSFAFYPELTRLNFDRCRVWSLALAALSIFSDILMLSVIFAPQDTSRTKCDRLSHKSLWSKWINFLKLLIGTKKACESTLMLNKQKKNV